MCPMGPQASSGSTLLGAGSGRRCRRRGGVRPSAHTLRSEARGRGERRGRQRWGGGPWAKAVAAHAAHSHIPPVTMEEPDPLPADKSLAQTFLDANAEISARLAKESGRERCVPVGGRSVLWGWGRRGGGSPWRAGEARPDLASSRGMRPAPPPPLLSPPLFFCGHGGALHTCRAVPRPSSAPALSGNVDEQRSGPATWGSAPVSACQVRTRTKEDRG